MQRDIAGQDRRLLAVVYRFEVWQEGERRLVTEEEVPASTLAMLLPQLHAVAKRSRVDAGPGLLVFDTFQQARQAAQTIATIASRVALREVTAGADSSAAAGEGWAAASGQRYRAVPGGVAIEVKT